MPMRDRISGKLVCRLAVPFVFAACPPARAEEAPPKSTRWLDEVLSVPYPPREAMPALEALRQDHGKLERGRSVIKTPLRIGGRDFAHGLGTHAVSKVRVASTAPLARFTAQVGVDNNNRTQGSLGSVVFAVSAGGKELYRSGVLRGGAEPAAVDVDAGGAKVLELEVGDGGDGPAFDHADWADAAVTLEGGKRVWIDEVEEGAPREASRFPFSFIYGGKSSNDLLGSGTLKQEAASTDAGAAGDEVELHSPLWTDTATNLQIWWGCMRFRRFPAVECSFTLHNTDKEKDTPILENVQALDLTFRSPLPGGGYRFHRTKGAPSNPTDFEVETVTVDEKHPQTLGAGGGRSSNRDFPFFKIETGIGSFIIAVGWSGQWAAKLESPDGRVLHVTAGIEKTHFKLHPFENVRMPSILIYHGEGDTLEANARFRELIYKHYAAKRGPYSTAEPLDPSKRNRVPLPTLFCNTCFTRGGGWLNECNAENQISLIKAYAPFGLEAILTDAGWFEGGWPAGAGNWNPRKDAYPQGMGPVAAAAKAHGMVYGLWFEPERVVKGTGIHKEHPEWCLASQTGPQDTYLLNFGLPEVQEHFFNIVKGFMDLPGFRFYRQDFNMDPLPYWRFNDAPDRKGITEIKYIEGLYAYWDRIAKAYPDSLREECASGGRRIDLETIRRMHFHQKSDYWFDNEVDQASLWALSQYLPNNVISVPINRLDDYSFHSVLPSSVIPGWIADAPDFDRERGRKLLARYLEVRRLLIGAWYPLLPYARDPERWIASQWHRADLNEGLVLAFRRAACPYRTVEVSLHGLDPDATYELAFDGTGEKVRAKGSALMKLYPLTLPAPHRSELIVYRRVEKGEPEKK